MLNFQNPLSRGNFKWHKKRVIGEWCAEKAAKVPVVLTDSWRELDMKKWSKRLWIKPVEWCCLKVNRFLLGLQILQISQRSRFSVISINFAVVFFLMTDLPPSWSREGYKITLKSPPNTTFVLNFFESF